MADLRSNPTIQLLRLLTIILFSKEIRIRGGRKLSTTVYSKRIICLPFHLNGEFSVDILNRSKLVKLNSGVYTNCSQVTRLYCNGRSIAFFRDGQTRHKP